MATRKQEPERSDFSPLEPFPDFIGGPAPEVRADPVAVLELDPVPAELVPEPLSYRVIVRPKPAASKVGSLYVAARTKNTDLAIRTIGQIVKLGPLAWRATIGGLDLNNDSVAHSIKPGDWVIFRQHGAQKIKIGRRPGEYDGDEEQDEYLLLMSDTDIMAKLTPEQAAKFYDWVS